MLMLSPPPKKKSKNRRKHSAKLKKSYLQIDGVSELRIANKRDEREIAYFFVPSGKNTRLLRLLLIGQEHGKKDRLHSHFLSNVNKGP